MAVPNQKIIEIHRIKPVKDFLQITNQNWMDACKDLTPSAFAVYLYLSSNKDGYKLELSHVAVANAIGVADKSYRGAIKLLIEKKYLIPKIENKQTFYEFYEVPNIDEIEIEEVVEVKNEDSVKIPVDAGKIPDISGKIPVKTVKSTAEIDNRYIDIIDNGSAASSLTEAKGKVMAAEEFDSFCKAHGAFTLDERVSLKNQLSIVIKVNNSRFSSGF